MLERWVFFSFVKERRKQIKFCISILDHLNFLVGFHPDVAVFESVIENSDARPEVSLHGGRDVDIEGRTKSFLPLSWHSPDRVLCFV